MATNVTIDIPKNAVPGSEHIEISAVGNVLLSMRLIVGVNILCIFINFRYEKDTRITNLHYRQATFWAQVF